jgi:ATP synthase subunit 6
MAQINATYFFGNIIVIFIYVVLIYLLIKTITITEKVQKYNIRTSLIRTVKEKGAEIREYWLKYFVVVFTTFIVILVLNLVGLVPYGFATTSHFSITFFFGLTILCTIIINFCLIHKINFLRFFVPAGAPLYVLPILIVIEFISFLIRGLSISIRLGANLISGHVFLESIASIILINGIYGILLYPAIVMFTVLEVLIAGLQSYVFTLLSISYYNEIVQE